MTIDEMRAEANKQGFNVFCVGENGTNYANGWFVEKDTSTLAGDFDSEQNALDWLFSFTGTIPGYKETEGPLLGPWQP